MTKKIITLIGLLLFSVLTFSQGVGSMSDDSNPADKRLVSLEFNGRIYAPRHGILPLKNYEAKFLLSDKRFTQSYSFRPVELLVSDDKGKSWTTASAVTVFESVQSPSLHVELMLTSDIAKMNRIDANHFALATEFRVSVSGSTRNYYYPVIYIFKENIKEGFYNVQDIIQFQPEAIDNNSVTEIKTEDNKTTFTLAKKGIVTFTLNPSTTEEFSFEDSFGNFLSRNK